MEYSVAFTIELLSVSCVFVCSRVPLWNSVEMVAHDDHVDVERN